MSAQSKRTFLRPVLAYGAAFIVVATASSIGSAATFPNIASWYSGLEKPPLNPPNWVFGPVWTTLYALMIWSFGRILLLPKATKGRTSATVWFVIQMALNGLWSVAFFGLNSTLYGLIVIAGLWIAILITILKFWPLSRLSSVLLWPYLLWVSFASYLNASLHWLNN